MRMIRGKRTIKWRSTYQESLGEFLSHSLNEHEKKVFEMLWVGYAIPMKLKSAYFELLRVGDGKYTLTVQKYVNNTHMIMFEINPNYGNALERFTS